MNRIKHIPRDADWFLVACIWAVCFFIALSLAGCAHPAPVTPKVAVAVPPLPTTLSSMKIANSTIITPPPTEKVIPILYPKHSFMIWDIQTSTDLVHWVFITTNAYWDNPTNTNTAFTNRIIKGQNWFMRMVGHTNWI